MTEEYKSINIRLDTATAEFVQRVATDAGVSNDQAASVIIALALRKELGVAKEAQQDKSVRDIEAEIEAAKDWISEFGPDLPFARIIEEALTVYPPVRIGRKMKAG